MTSLQRQTSAPDLPTMAEFGFPGFEVTVWFGLMAPAGTQPTIIQKLHGETARILRVSPCSASASRTLGLETDRQYTFGICSRHQNRGFKWAKVIKEAGISLLD